MTLSVPVGNASAGQIFHTDHRNPCLSIGGEDAYHVVVFAVEHHPCGVPEVCIACDLQ